MPPTHGVAPFWDPAVYARENERVFARAWLFVGHTAMIPHAGDYATNYMGEDPVIVSRGQDGTVRAAQPLPASRQQSCTYDRGTTKAFRCSYHGWTFGGDGALWLQSRNCASSIRRLPARGPWTRQRAARPVFRDRSLRRGPESCARGLPAPTCAGTSRRFCSTIPMGSNCCAGLHRYRIPATGNSWRKTRRRCVSLRDHPRSLAALQRAGEAPRGRCASSATSQRFGVEVSGAGGVRTVSCSSAWERSRWRRSRASERSPRSRPGCSSGIAARSACAVASFACTAARGKHLAEFQLQRFPAPTAARCCYGIRAGRVDGGVQWCFVERPAPLEVKERMAFTVTQRQSAAGSWRPTTSTSSAHPRCDAFAAGTQAWSTRTRRRRRWHVAAPRVARPDRAGELRELPARVLPLLARRDGRRVIVDGGAREILRGQVTAFYAYETALLDDGNYRAWLELLDDDVRYVMPARETRQGPPPESDRGLPPFYLFDDDKPSLEARVARLETGLAPVASPPPATQRLVTDVLLVEVGDDALLVRSSFLLYLTRDASNDAFFIGRRRDRLRPHAGSFRGPGARSCSRSTCRRRPSRCSVRGGRPRRRIRLPCCTAPNPCSRFSPRWR